VQKSQTWHYGVVSHWWAEFNLDGPEIGYFQRFIEDGGEPALDLACGAGRLLVPFLRAGLDVDGVDVSADMLARCRERAEQHGLTPTLYAQAMHELDLPRRYKTIIVCGGFGLGSTREQDLEALRRIYEHLEAGGLFLLDNEAPYADSAYWKCWHKDERNQLPRAFAPSGERRRGSDGAEYELRARILDFDPLEQTFTMEMLAEMWRGDEQVAYELHELTMTMYFQHELLLMLEQAGFDDVVVRGGYENDEPTGDHDFLVYIARKP
jgi:SAM-dependent methyltransferase